MIICVDIRTLVDKKYSGVGIYTFKLLESLFEIDKENKYKLFYNSYNTKLVKRFYPNVDYYDFNISNKLFNLSSFLFKYPKFENLIKGCDIFFAPNANFFSFSKDKKIKKVITIHDLSFELFPNFYSRKNLLWHKFINVKKIIKEFDHFITVSDNTKIDLINLFKIKEDRITTTHLSFGYLKNKPEISLTVKEIIKTNYLLNINTIEPRKNIEGILKAFEELNNENRINNFNLVIAGKNGWNNKYIFKIIESSKFKDKIKVLDYISEQDKIELYKNAKLFLFPTFYEGFGIPALEAQNFGVPVISSSNSSLSEILNTSALMINPYNVNEIKFAILQLLENPDLYEKYKKLGKENSEKYSWQETARKTLEVFKKLKK